MKALILAAGEGQRLRPLTLDRPKPMLPIGGRPLLDYLITWLRHHGIDKIAINLHYRPEVICTYFGDGSRLGVQLTYSYEPDLLGSAGAAKRLESFFDERLLVIYGDVLTDLDLTSLIDQHRHHGGLATLAVHRVPDPHRCGIVDVDERGRIRRFIEKPPAGATASNLANAGLYVLERASLEQVPTNQPYDFGHDLFPRLVAQGQPLYAVELPGYILDIGSHERYAQAELDLRSGRYIPADAVTPVGD